MSIKEDFDFAEVLHEMKETVKRARHYIAKSGKKEVKTNDPAARLDFNEKTNEWIVYDKRYSTSPTLTEQVRSSVGAVDAVVKYREHILTDNATDLKSPSSFALKVPEKIYFEDEKGKIWYYDIKAE